MNLPWLKDYNLLIFDKLDSTNSEALRLATAGVSGDFIILAGQQTAGRGQRGKEWRSLLGNLHFTILLDNGENFKRSPQISFVAANALYNTIESFAKEQSKSPKVTLKWPNDVLLNGQKFAGILLESININKKSYVAIGVGVNLVAHPCDIEYSVTNLAKEGIVIDRSDDFLNAFVKHFDSLIRGWRVDNNFIKTRQNWLKHAHNLNRPITIDNGIERVSGIFKEIDFDGSIRIEIADGNIRNFVAGEVTYGEMKYNE